MPEVIRGAERRTRPEKSPVEMGPRPSLRVPGWNSWGDNRSAIAAVVAAQASSRPSLRPTPFLALLLERDALS